MSTGPIQRRAIHRPAEALGTQERLQSECPLWTGTVGPLARSVDSFYFDEHPWHRPSERGSGGHTSLVKCPSSLLIAHAFGPPLSLSADQIAIGNCIHLQTKSVPRRPRSPARNPFWILALTLALTHLRYSVAVHTDIPTRPIPRSQSPVRHRPRPPRQCSSVQCSACFLFRFVSRHPLLVWARIPTDPLSATIVPRESVNTSVGIISLFVHM